MLLFPNSKIRVFEGAADNLPDQAAHQAAQEIARVVETAGADDILIVLISGGGSALLPYPVPPLTIEDTLAVTRLLARSGVNILDLNMVRKQLERLKGGGLARLARPAKVVSLILSDIIGDDLGFIASGPTVTNTSSAQDCLDLFDRFNVSASVPAPVKVYLENEAASSKSPTQEDFSHVSNVLIGTNRIACGAASSKSSSLGFLPYVLSTELCGEAKSVGVMFAVLAKYIAGVANELRVADPTKSIEVKIKGHVSGSDTKTSLLRQRLMAEFGLKETTLRDIDALVLKARQSKSARGVCVVAGGETTVTVRGNGKGGRNQEMAVAAGVELHTLFYDGNTQAGPSTSHSHGKHSSDENPSFIRRFGDFGSARSSESKSVASNEGPHQISANDLVFLSGGTDGQDGPTSAAGGMVDGDFLHKASQAGLDVVEYLDNNDSFTLLTKLDGGSNLVVTGLTGTNVMDLQILVVQLLQS
ncbi:glycerate kinase [Elysia marginata]|uniref:Glycerate kinase n=1 Tax=Elysia marginata TaxID=1093978 RepID=A0AAV4F1F5_9GAST|nr:glycerate kinase [Elysia marginata]